MENYDNMSEQEIAMRMMLCDMELLHWLLHVKYRAGLRYLVYRYYGACDETEDVISELTELLIKKDCRVLKTFRKEASFRTWLFTVARNLICRRLSKRREHSELKPDRAGADHYNIDAVLDVGMILDRLSPKHRMVLDALFIRGVSVEELAAQLGRTPPYIYNLKHRALASARLVVEYMARECEESGGKPAEYSAKYNAKYSAKYSMNNEKKNRKK
ncbi:MAG: sigma-70 family RNA polymerase sigma factor [Prevotellaceae bacterium]|jgi:RNA polymerase sigma-70 factor (ECF subfamily)|nr:sigma-70 family RNA polymerase sigma factor [Prevotellaceae bacterium]